jgi:hypothetical protein
VVHGVRGRCLLGSLAAAVAAAGCAGEKSTAPRPVAGTVALAAGQYALYTGAQATGPLAFPAADSAGAQYLVVGQLATGVADVGAAFTLAGATPGSPAAARVAMAPEPAPRLPFALRFHDALRRLDEAAARAAPARPGARAPAAPAPFRGPPVLGSQHAFVVCGDAACQTTTTDTATVRYVGTHSAIYVSKFAPSGGLQASDLQQLGAQFDSVLYPIDTAAFGAPSDVDTNGVVLILLTPDVNALTPVAQCASSFVSGFFLGYDLAPQTRTVYNHGEILYGIVPDPTGQVSCPFTVSQVLAVIPSTFVHEFQHMISFNQHVLLRNGTPEVLWLNEALSHLAEELVGLHYDSLNDGAEASNFLLGDFYDAFQYLVSPSTQPVVTLVSPGTLAARGSEWLFARYLVDQFGPALTQRLEQTALTGEANVEAATGAPLATLLGRWALALWMSDLPGAAPDPALQYRTWALRATFANLHSADPTDFYMAFPLAPGTTSAASFSLTGTVTSGSGAYLVVTQPAGAAALTISFTTPGGGSLPASGDPQLAIVRIR